MAPGAMLASRSSELIQALSVARLIDRFLKADLAAVNRTETPWVLAFGHRPFYNGIADALCKPCKAAFEDLLYEGGVDLVMNGHNHVFSVSHPVYKSESPPRPAPSAW